MTDTVTNSSGRSARQIKRIKKIAPSERIRRGILHGGVFVTLDDIKSMDKDFLTPSEVASIMGCAPQLIRTQATQHPELLGFHFCKVGNRIRIPRESFIRWMQES